jgi:hypothetical protein
LIRHCAVREGGRATPLSLPQLRSHLKPESGARRAGLRRSVIPVAIALCVKVRERSGARPTRFPHRAIRKCLILFSTR